MKEELNFVKAAVMEVDAKLKQNSIKLDKVTKNHEHRIERLETAIN